METENTVGIFITRKLDKNGELLELWYSSREGLFKARDRLERLKAKDKQGGK